MIAGAQHNERMALRDHFRAVLLEVAKQRHLMSGVVQTADGPEVEWLAYERAQMLHGVNTARAGRGLPPALLADVERCDRLAEGASWLDKFS